MHRIRLVRCCRGNDVEHPLATEDMQLGTGLPQDLFEPLLRPCLIRCQPVVQNQRVALVFHLDAEQVATRVGRLEARRERLQSGACHGDSSLLASVSAPWLPTM